MTRRAVASRPFEPEFVEGLADVHFLMENGLIVDRLEAANFAAQIGRIDKLLGV